MSNRIVKTKASPAFVSQLEVDDLIVNGSINEDSVVVDTTEDYVVTTLGPSIIAADTTAGEVDITLPPLADNIGRKIYVVNIGAANNININASGSDTITAAAQSSIVVLPAVTTTILIGTADYWEQVATGGGGGGTTTYDVITGIYDTGWISNSDWTDAEFNISHNFGKPLSELIVKFYYSPDGFDNTAIQIDFQFTHDDGIGADGGQVVYAIDNNQFKIQTGASGIYIMTDSGLQDRLVSTIGYYRVVVYDPQKIAAASAVEKYSTGWINKSDWTSNNEVIVHGLNTPFPDLIVKIFLSNTGSDDDCYELVDTTYDRAASSNLDYGLTFYAIDNNSFGFRTPSGGLQYITSGFSNGVIASNEYYKVVVYKPTFLERNLEVTKYDTGWINRTDWTAAQISVTHNLGAELPELITKFYLSSDGTDANAFEIGDMFRADVNALDVNNYYGFQYEAVDNNGFTIHTPSDGIVYISASNQFAELGGSTSFYYRVVVYKPKIMEAASPVAVSAKSIDYTIASRNDSRIIAVNTGGTDKTVTLPDSTISQLIPGDEFEVIKENNGSGQVTFATQGTDVIEGLSYVTLNLQYDRARVRYIRNGWFQLIEHRQNAFDALADGVGTYIGMGKYDTGWVANSDWTDSNITITHNLGKPVEELIIKWYISEDGAGTNEYELWGTDANVNDSGLRFITIDNNSFTFKTGSAGLIAFNSNGTVLLLDVETRYYRVVVYDPQRISAAPSVEKYSTGWVNNTDWTNAEFLVTHGMNAPLTDLFVKFFVSPNSDGSGAIEPIDSMRAYAASLSGSDTHDGYAFYEVSDNQIKVQTGQDGLHYVTDGGTLARLDTENWYYNVVIYKPTFIAREYEVMKYDTGWTANSDWTNWNPTITHNLGAPLEELIVKVFLSSSSDGSSFVRELNALPPDSNASFGFFIHSTNTSSNNAITLQSGVGGIYILDFNGNRTLIDTESWYYRVIIYKPALLEKASPVAVRAVSGDYTIQGRSDSSHISVTTATNAINIQCNTSDFIIGDKIKISKADSGTGTVAFVGTNVEGFSNGIYLHSQHNFMELEWNGTDFTLTQYKDHGSNSDGEWTRSADGTQVCRRRISLGTISVTSSYGNLFIDNAGGYGPWTYPIAFASGTLPVLNWTAESSGILFWLSSGTTAVGTNTQTPDDLRIVKGTSGNVTNAVISYIAHGRWRP